MTKPFSVSLSVYQNDDSNNFKAAFLSIINQTLLPSEIILVIDGPIPIKTRKIISDFELNYKFLKVIDLKQNQGHGNARRIGLNKCTNEIIALMDSDDISVHNRFELQYNFLANNPEVSLVGGQIEEFIDDIDNIVSKREVPLIDEKIKKYLKSRCPFNQMTVMFYKNKVIEAGGYKDWYCNEDYYLWIRMYLKNIIFSNLKDTLVKVRIDDKMFLRRAGWKYFKSELGIQKLLLTNKIITPTKFSYNVIIRIIIQLFMSNRIRKFVFLRLIRK
tara:strand:+ start:1801 stop:2622 length:822 start_codon:yes stop_codon:yes gene_type:complete